MEFGRLSTNQTIDLASVGRASVLAQFLAADQPLAAALADWIEQLVGTASDLAIKLDARDVRTMLPAPIATLEDVITWIQPRALLSYGAVAPVTAHVLARWCEDAAVCVAALLSVRYRVPTDPGAIATHVSPFQASIPLTIYQWSALGAFLQVADDSVTVLGRLLQLARAPRAALLLQPD